MSIDSFAPVVIPTLCRYNHFIKCIESLMRCTYADKTDVFIGLDYPAKESHWEGYQKILAYLNELSLKHKFKSLNIIKRDKNYGFGQNGNESTLVKYVLQHYDRYIFSEDDNIFSEAFLDYINTGLQLYYNDKTVLAINGYRHFYDVKFKKNTYYRQNVDFSAWGYGMWRDRREFVERFNNSRNWKLKALNPINWIRIKKNGLNRLLQFISIIFATKSLNDSTLSVYMGINKMDVIMPKESMVRNMGWDGSGEHCKEGEVLAVKHNTKLIDKSTDFTYKGNGNEYYKYNHKIYVKQSYGRITVKEFFNNLFRSIIRHTRGRKRKYLSIGVVW